MFFWFAGLSFAMVLVVFDSPLLDYRLIVAGSLIPWLDHLWGPPWPLHSVLTPVALMAVIMVVFQGRRLVQRRWLGLPIGMFVHLLLDATFTRSRLFWWPARGVSIDDSGPLVPSLPLALVLEAVGVAALVWLVISLGLGDKERATKFFSTGHIDRGRLPSQTRK